MKAALGLPITVALFLLTAVQTDEAKAEGCGHFFEHTGIFDGGGRGIMVCGEQAALGWFNDRISSYVIEPNTDCVITEHVDFGGSYVYLHADQQARRMPEGWNDKVSSIKCEHQGFFQSPWPNPDRAIVYEHAHVAGAGWELPALSGKADYPGWGLPSDFRGEYSWWNDRASSIKTGAYTNCKFYSDNFSGEELRVNKGSYIPRLSELGWNDRISSAECSSSEFR